LGAGAEILATRQRRKYRLFGPVQHEIVARAGSVSDAREAAATGGDRPPGIQATLQELLITAGVAPGLATMLSVNSLLGQAGHLVSAKELAGRLGAALAEMVGTVRPAEVGKGGSRVIAFIGPHGGGKTTALAKLACELVLAGSSKVALLTADTYRLGAMDQLGRYAAILSSYFGAAYTPGELRRLRDEAGLQADITLVDTPGCNWRSKEDLSNLSSLLEAAQPDEVHLVVPAVYQLSVAEHLIAAFRPLGVDRLLITKLDEAETYGPVINLVAGGRLPLSYAGLGADVPGTLWVPDPGDLARMLLAGRSPQDPVSADKGEVGAVGHGPA
jgi:flagellar biosynthesis GTPase FlhF